MLNAYSRLAERDASRAERALNMALSRAQTPPFHIEERPEFEQPGFARATELLRQGDIDSARRELEALDILGERLPCAGHDVCLVERSGSRHRALLRSY
jgi:hypothetical protein